MRRSIFFTLIGCLLMSHFFTWWSMCVVTATAGLFFSRHWRAIANGFLSGFVLWAGWPLLVHYTGHGVLAPRLAQSFHLPWWPLIFLASGLIGGALGMTSCWFGFTFKQLVLTDLVRRPRR
jgi:hypothetical protein